MNTFTPLEDQVLQMLLAGAEETLIVLRQQVDQAKITSRKMTGVGFFVDILIPADVTRPVERPSLILSDVNGTAANVKNGMGFLLYVTDGAISMLEGYTFDEPWPLEVDGLVLAYSSGKNRDLDNVRRIIQKAALHS